MRAAGVRDTAIRAFKHSYQSLLAGDTGLIPEETIQAITELPRLEQVEAKTRVQTELLSHVVMVKLNGAPLLPNTLTAVVPLVETTFS